MNRQKKIDSFFPKKSNSNTPKRDTVINRLENSDKNDNPKVPSSQIEAITLSSDDEDMKPKAKVPIPRFIIADESDVSTVEEVPSKEANQSETLSVGNNIRHPIEPQNQCKSPQNEPNTIECKSPVNEPEQSTSSENHPKIREFSIPCLDQVSTLLHVAKKRNLENNIEAVQDKYYEKRKVPYLEDSWFYFNCDEKCDPDCEGECSIRSAILRVVPSAQKILGTIKLCRNLKKYFRTL